MGEHQLGLLVTCSPLEREGEGGKRGKRERKGEREREREEERESEGKSEIRK